ncbi:MAG: hypothetical protein Q7U53_07860 [Anaerolineaceae bacterium]|nr:hypothetical protein [Anaerolineaceae bacterium]
MNQHFIKIMLLIGMFILLLPSCNLPQSTLPTNTPNQTQPEDTATVATAITSTDQIGLIFLVALEDNGVSGKKIGCEDSLVAVEVPLVPVKPDPWSALSALFSLDQPYFGESGLYNSLYQSNLNILEIEIDNMTAKIYLEGELMLGGVCDNPRVEEQILATILQFEEYNTAEVYINGVLLQDLLSLQ